MGSPSPFPYHNPSWVPDGDMDIKKRDGDFFYTVDNSKIFGPSTYMSTRTIKSGVNFIECYVLLHCFGFKIILLFLGMDVIILCFTYDIFELSHYITYLNSSRQSYDSFYSFSIFILPFNTHTYTYIFCFRFDSLILTKKL